MALDIKFSSALKVAQQNAITSTLATSAVIRIYSGVKPAGPDIAVTSQVLLASLSCSAVFAPSASNGVLTLNTITSGVGSAGASTGIIATWFRIVTSAGVAHIDGNVGFSNCDMNLNNTNIATGQSISVTSMTLTNGN